MDKQNALADIAEALKFNVDHGGSGAVEMVSVRLHAAVLRNTPACSSYRKQAERALVSEKGRPGKDVQMRAILESLRADILSDRLQAFEQVVHTETFGGFLGQARALNTATPKPLIRAAAVIAGGTLEQHLRELARLHGVSIVKADGKPEKAATINIELRKQGVYDKTRWKEVETWQSCRNDAAHGDLDFEKNFDEAWVDRMIDGISDFIDRHPA